MSDISKLPARQVDQSHDTLAGLAREVLEKWEQANKEPRHTHLKHDNWMIYDIITTAGHLATQAWQPFHEYSRSSQDAEYHVAAANAAPQLATAYLEQQSYIDTYKVGAETIIKRLREALEAVKPFYYVTGDDGIPKRYCWWCHVVADVSGEYTHAPDCLYQRALTSKQP